MCSRCGQESCYNSELCGRNPARPPITVSFEELVKNIKQISKQAVAERRPVATPTELLRFFAAVDDRPICFRGFHIAGRQKYEGAKKEDLRKEIEVIFNSGFKPILSMCELSRYPPPLLLPSIGTKNPICSTPWPPSAVCLTTRFEVAALFPFRRRSDPTFSVVYAIVPGYLWEIRRLQLALSEQGLSTPFPALEYAMNYILPEWIAAAVIFKRDADEYYWVDAFFDHETELILSPAYLKGLLGTAGPRAITLLQGRILSKKCGYDNVGLVDKSKIDGAVFQAAQMIATDADALRDETMRTEKAEWETIMSEFHRKDVVQ